MTHYYIWLSKESEHVIIIPADKGYEVMEEMLDMMKQDGHRVDEIERRGRYGTEYWFPLKKE